MVVIFLVVNFLDVLYPPSGQLIRIRIVVVFVVVVFIVIVFVVIVFIVVVFVVLTSNSSVLKNIHP